jgi:hypothetical protein
VPCVGGRLEGAHARRHQVVHGRVAQLEHEQPGVEARELEQVVDEVGEGAHLLPQRGQVAVRVAEAVLERLDHRLHRRERRAQVVAGPRDELPARVEELLEGGGHPVERRGELSELGRAAFLDHPLGEIARRERRGRVPYAVEPVRDRPGQQQPRDRSRARRRRRDAEDLDVVVHVEHDEAGEEDGAERQRHREHGQRRELQPNRRERAEQQAGDDAGRERAQPDEERELGHGTSL